MNLSSLAAPRIRTQSIQMAGRSSGNPDAQPKQRARHMALHALAVHPTHNICEPTNAELQRFTLGREKERQMLLPFQYIQPKGILFVYPTSPLARSLISRAHRIAAARDIPFFFSSSLFVLEGDQASCSLIFALASQSLSSIKNKKIVVVVNQYFINILFFFLFLWALSCSLFHCLGYYVWINDYYPLMNHSVCPLYSIIPL